MRTLRTATPIPQPSQFDESVYPHILPPRRSKSSAHLPTLSEGSLDCNTLSRIAPPAFSKTELVVGKTEIIALVGSPSHPRRGQLFKSALERRRSQESARLPNLLSRDSTKENVKPGSGERTRPPSSEWVRRLHRPQHYELTRTVSHPVNSNAGKSTLAVKQSSYTNSKSLPRLNHVNNAEPLQAGPENKHSADLRRHIEQEELDYDLFTTKAVILERFLNSQS